MNSVKEINLMAASKDSYTRKADADLTGRCVVIVGAIPNSLLGTAAGTPTRDTTGGNH